MCTKVSLCCGQCKIVYNYDKYGNKAGKGERHYNQPRDAVEGSDVAYLDRPTSQALLVTVVGYITVSRNFAM